MQFYTYSQFNSKCERFLDQISSGLVYCVAFDGRKILTFQLLNTVMAPPGGAETKLNADAYKPDPIDRCENRICIQNFKCFSGEEVSKTSTVQKFDSALLN